MADLTGRNADETKPDIATWGSGNVLETGEGTVKVDLDDKASLSVGNDGENYWEKRYNSAESGVMEARRSNLRLDTFSAGLLFGTWNFPKEFSTTDGLVVHTSHGESANLKGSSSQVESWLDVGPLRTLSLSTTSVQIRMYPREGSFMDGDHIDINIRAKGYFDDSE